MTEVLRKPARGNPLNRFFQLSSSRRRLLGEAVVWLAIARIALLAVPFRHLAGWFGALDTPARTDKNDAGELLPEERACALEIGWAVTRAARYVPLRAVCLPQAIAAKAMLNRRHVANVMHFGVAKEIDEPLKAHAWLDAAAVEVTGFPVAPDMVEVARFV
jgi:hypothetical protein